MGLFLTLLEWIVTLYSPQAEEVLKTAGLMHFYASTKWTQAMSISSSEQSSSIQTKRFQESR